MKKAVHILRIVLISILGFILIAALWYKYSWRLFGFNACTRPTPFHINNMSVSEKNADFTASYYGDSISCFEGYTYKVKDDVLYIGIKVLPFLANYDSSTGRIHIQTKEPFSRIVLTDGKAEEQIYPETE